MPIEFNMRISSEMSAPAVLDKVMHCSGFHTAGHLLEPSLSCVDARAESALDQELVRESFGLTPTVRLDIQLDKFGDLDRGMDLVVDAISLLLVEIPCDMLLLENNERALLLRRNGITLVPPKSDFWTTGRRSKLDFPTETVELPKWVE